MTFLFFYTSVLFLYSIIGVILFQDIPEFDKIQTALYTLFRASVGAYDLQLLENATEHSLGSIYFNSFVIINVILLVNLIVAQLANAYKRVNKDRNVHWLLQTLSVREVSEADGKYSAVVSAPFPICTLNLILGSIVLAAKSPSLNEYVLHLYFIPVLIGSLISFIVYQIVILPFVYVKMVFHKWALVVKAPKGMGSVTFCDRAGRAIVFMLFGPLLLIANALIDIVWFLIHIYKKDLDKTVTKRAKSEVETELPEIHRRTYKKMLRYFETQND